MLDKLLFDIVDAIPSICPVLACFLPSRAPVELATVLQLTTFSDAP